MSLLCNVIKKLTSVNFQLCLVDLSRVFAVHSDWLNVLWHALCCLVLVLVYPSIYPPSPHIRLSFRSLSSFLLSLKLGFFTPGCSTLLSVTCATFVCMLYFVTLVFTISIVNHFLLTPGRFALPRCHRTSRDRPHLPSPETSR